MIHNFYGCKSEAEVPEIRDSLRDFLINSGRLNNMAAVRKTVVWLTSEISVNLWQIKLLATD